jgi:hypothetical protein
MSPRVSLPTTALLGVALLGSGLFTSAARAGRQKQQRQPVAQKDCKGPRCTCCLQTDKRMVNREAAAKALPAEKVLARGRRLIAYKKLSDADAVKADMERILMRSRAMTAAKEARALSIIRASAQADGAPRAGMVPGLRDKQVPNGFGGWLARMGYVRKHGPWHAVHNAARLTPDELAFVENTLGWKAPRDANQQLIKQEGMPESGYKFLGMHGGMAEAAEGAGVTGGRIRAFTKEEWETLKPVLTARNQDIAEGMDMVMELVTAFQAAEAAGTTAKPQKTRIGDLFKGYPDSTDIFGNWLQTTQRRDTNAKRLTRLPVTAAASKPSQRKVERTAGMHNLVHVILSTPGSSIDMGNPELNLYNELFWMHHGTIEKAKQAFLKWYATKPDQEAYGKVQAEEMRLMNPGDLQGQHMMRSIRKLDVHQFTAADQAMWRSIQSKISPEATLRATGAIQ